MQKNLPFIFMLLLLNACSGSRYYFNKRIDHPEKEIKQEPAFIEEIPVDIHSEKNEVSLVLPEIDPIPVKEEATLLSEKKEDQVETHSLAKPVSSMEKAPQENSTVTLAKKTFSKQTFSPASSSGIGGWGVFFLVMGGIFLLTVLISLLLGYAIGQALLYGLIAILIVVILIVWLLLGGGNWGNSSDNDDDDGDGTDD